MNHLFHTDGLTSFRLENIYYSSLFWGDKNGDKNSALDSEIKNKMISEIKNKQLNVLIVDDDAQYRNSISFKLSRQYNAKVSLLGSGIEAIKSTENGKSYDLILIDLMMPPGITGLETYFILKENNVCKKMVIMSAFESSNEWGKAMELGIPLLPKIYNDNELLILLNEACK